jgi:hypothetical protein
VARALGVLALLAVVIGITSWPRISPATAVLALSAARGGDAELRRATPRSDEKARRPERAPTQVGRARPQDRPDLRLPPLLGAAAVAVREGRVGRLPVGVRRDDGRGRMALHEAAPESAGHRAANPVRGPPARDLASI